MNYRVILNYRVIMSYYQNFQSFRNTTYPAIADKLAFC
jgi:hypothetical protein